MTEATQRLVTDLKVLLGDTEDLLKATAAQGGEKAADMRARMQQAIGEIRPQLARAEALLEERTRAAVKTTDDYVHARPWTAVGIAACVGLVVGMLAGRH